MPYDASDVNIVDRYTFNSVWLQAENMGKILFHITICGSLFLLLSCSYSAWHEGFRELQRNRCYELHGEAFSECLDSLDYSVEEYEEERERTLKHGE